jgi:membrane-associated phospholipid phosphatase
LSGRNLRAAVLLWSLLATASVGNAQVQDTIYNKTPLFEPKDALLIGVFAIGTVAVAPIDLQIASKLQYPGRQENRFLKNAATGFRILGDPGSLITSIGIYVIGRIDDQPRVQALGLHSAESILLGGAIGGTIKVLAGRQRPYVDIKNPHSFQLGRGFSGDEYRSFPSGHTIAAFAFASSLTRETQFWWPHAGFWIGTVFYGGAGMVGLSRMYNNMHWASDVVAGAAIGTIVGLKVVKYTHSNPDSRIDNKLIKPKKSSIQFNPVLYSIRF